MTFYYQDIVYVSPSIILQNENNYIVVIVTFIKFTADLKRIMHLIQYGSHIYATTKENDKINGESKCYINSRSTNINVIWNYSGPQHLTKQL